MQLWLFAIAFIPATLCNLMFTEATIVDDAPTELYDHSAELIAGVYKLYWKTTGEKSDDRITFEVRVATKGWIGLGFSPNGGMPGSDVVVGGVDKNGKGYLWDRYATATIQPEYDQQQDYELLYSAETKDGTVLKFRRHLNTCDKENDLVLGTDTIRLIFAFHASDAISKDSFAMHDQRGTRSVLLFRPQQPNSQRSAALPPNVQTLELRANNVVVPGNRTTVHWCKPFDLSGRFTQKQTLVRYDPIIDPANVEYLHHILVYYCYFNVTKFGEGYCFVPDDNGIMFKGEPKCNHRAITGWAVGGTEVVYPENVGVPLFEEGASTIFMMEIHYNNPNGHTFTDNSGMRLHLSSTPREVESSGVLMGLRVDKRTIIPPRQKSVKLYAICPADCTQRLPESGIDVFGVFLHAHILGISIRVRHFRNGTELKPLAADEHFDFNYQERRGLPTPVKVLPVCENGYTHSYKGDMLVTECTYDSSSRSTVTLGGPSTEEEMCAALLEYYPRIPGFAACASLPSLENVAQALNVTLVNPGLPIALGKDKMEVTLHDYASTQFIWTGEATEAYLRKLSAGTYDAGCIGAWPDVNHTLKLDEGLIDEPPEVLEILDRNMLKRRLPDLTKSPSLNANDPCEQRVIESLSKEKQSTIAPESKQSKNPDSSQASIHSYGIFASFTTLISICLSLLV